MTKYCLKYLSFSTLFLAGMTALGQAPRSEIIDEINRVEAVYREVAWTYPVYFKSSDSVKFRVIHKKALEDLPTAPMPKDSKGRMTFMEGFFLSVYHEMFYDLPEDFPSTVRKKLEETPANN